DAAARTDSPAGKAALVVLRERWPGRLPFAELVRAAAAKLGREPIPEDTETLSRLLSAIWMTGMVALHGHCPRYVETISERPVANPLARIQVRTIPLATTMLHTSMLIEDAPSLRLIELLDGTRDRGQLAAELMAAFPPDNRPDPAALRTGLDRNLERLAKAGLLIG
ncbi:MAG TPA: hypothetical protein VKE74_16185, partial [Gemmataceae bacterium]|nr:hypothetical protein [Gemmataceae bacterium]